MVDEKVREDLAKQYPRKNLFIDPVAIYGFLTIWAIVGWFLAGLFILLRIGSGQEIPGIWILSFLVCAALTAVFGILTARNARLQRKAHTHEEE